MKYRIELGDSNPIIREADLESREAAQAWAHEQVNETRTPFYRLFDGDGHEVSKGQWSPTRDS